MAWLRHSSALATAGLALTLAAAAGVWLVGQTARKERAMDEEETCGQELVPTRIAEPLRSQMPVIQHEEGGIGRWMRIVLLAVAHHDGRWAQLAVPVWDEETGTPLALPLIRRWTALGYAHRVGQGPRAEQVMLTLWQPLPRR